MKRFLTLIAVLVGLSLLPLTGATAKTKTKKEGGKSAVKCPTQKTLKKRGIEGCPDTGCGGSLDPLLNQQKNTTEGDPDTARHITFADFAGIPNVVEGYKGIGFPRDKVRDQGEGDMVRVVGWALDSRPQKTRGKDKNGKPKKGESCNCGFTGIKDPQNTDVHIVLVDDAALELKANAGKGKSAAVNTLKKREAQSQTVEYTPRVRVSRGEEFDGSKLKNLIGPPGGALKVRVTGLLLYDSEHALGPFKLTRKTDWEIHPVFRLEYCPKNKACADKGTANWVDINK
jgi:hypothetical protein